MLESLKYYSRRSLTDLFTFKKTSRTWHIPILAALCVGIPLFFGLYLNELQSGLLASLSGLVILYIPVASGILKRMIVLFMCSFGFLLSYTVGLVFSFDPFISALAFGAFSIIVYWLSLKLKLKAPGNFFFIMLAAISSSLPYDPSLIPQKIGLIALGSSTACFLALIYSLSIRKKTKLKPESVHPIQIIKSKTVSFIESIIMGVCMFFALYIGHLLNLKNAYWIPISCLAVMQGITLFHVWQRVFHRVLGTFVGLCFCWLILSFERTPLSICLSIVLLQYCVEFLIVRNYALAVVFITPMTLLLVEAANPLILDPNQLFIIRFYDIFIGSSIGAIGGWFIYSEKLKRHTKRQVRKAKVILKRRRFD